eukprot:scaffold10064_cov130-Isochrysis_galbana.AAC.2
MPRSAARISSTLSCPKQRSMVGRTAARGGVPGSAASESQASLTAAAALSHASSFRMSSGMELEAGPNRAPVSARHGPRLPGSVDRKKEAPTSGNMPMFVSGMANTVFSVAMRNAPCTEMPAPPPMQKPSQMETCGFCDAAMTALSWYLRWQGQVAQMVPSVIRVGHAIGADALLAKEGVGQSSTRRRLLQRGQHQAFHVAAGAEGLALPREQDTAHTGVAAALVQSRMELADHWKRESIEGLRPGQSDAGQAPSPLERHLRRRSCS